MSRSKDKDKDKGRLPPFVPLILTTIDSPAWRTMSHGARSLYVALRRRYSQHLHNNGRIYLSQRVAAKEIGSHHNEIARWFRELQFYGFIVMTKGGSLGVEGRGKAPHWCLTELGHMNDLPTRDFDRWAGAKFIDRKTKPRAPFPSHTEREMAHTQVREKAHTARPKRGGNGAHTAAADDAGIQHIPSFTTPPRETPEPVGEALYRGSRVSSADRPSGGAPNGPASARSEDRRRPKKRIARVSAHASGADCSDGAISFGKSPRSRTSRFPEVTIEAKHERISESGVSKRTVKNSEPLRHDNESSTSVSRKVPRQKPAAGVIP